MDVFLYFYTFCVQLWRLEIGIVMYSPIIRPISGPRSFKHFTAIILRYANF